MIRINTRLMVATVAVLGIQAAHAASSIIVPMYLVSADGQGQSQSQSIGSVKLETSACGVLITPNLHDLPPGIHGFHVHETPSCAEKGMAAGAHFDPEHTNEHNGPYEHKSHLGDLPVLVVDQAGKATLPTLAPRFTLADFKDHALMIHAGGDNYSNNPKLGGGGDRIACGVIAK